ncbi:hypothetical protein DOZ80_25475 [Pseudomonas fluorescens]|uniref:Uncharacterized protein n=1 Tax=Pseudomonas fluorescens TaxID=294 RepID=A0A327MQV1_PSEFL|nr:hypothetical protein DOZ80_25475 [Pseudomonas fluorescens]
MHRNPGMTPMIADASGRRFRSLRLSLSAACNYTFTCCLIDDERLVTACYRHSAEGIFPRLLYHLHHSSRIGLSSFFRLGSKRNDEKMVSPYLVRSGEHLKNIDSCFCINSETSSANSTALCYQVGSVGCFSATSDESISFCKTCTRLHLSSARKMHGCLSSNKEPYICGSFKIPDNRAAEELLHLLDDGLKHKKSRAHRFRHHHENQR